MSLEDLIKKRNSVRNTVKLIRKGLIKEYFEPIFEEMGYEKINFPANERISFLSPSKIFCISFDLETADDYAAGANFFAVDFILMLPNLRRIHDKMKKFFRRVKIGKSLFFYRREMVWYAGRNATVENALNYILKIEDENMEMLKEYII